MLGPALSWRQGPARGRQHSAQRPGPLQTAPLRSTPTCHRASKAIAAFEGRSEVAVEDIYRVIPLCLRHRLRKDPLADIDSGDKVREVFKTVFGME